MVFKKNEQNQLISMHCAGKWSKNGPEENQTTQDVICRLLSNFVVRQWKLDCSVSYSQIMHSKYDDEDSKGLFKFTYSASAKLHAIAYSVTELKI